MSAEEKTARERHALLREQIRISSDDTAMARALREAARLPKVQEAFERDRDARERMLLGRTAGASISDGRRDGSGRTRKEEKA